MTAQYQVNEYTRGINSFGLNAAVNSSDLSIYSATLAANADTTVTCPSNSSLGTGSVGTTNYYLAIITASGAGVYVNFGATATVPAGASFAATTSLLVPSNREFGRYIKGGTVLHFKTAASNVDVTVEFRVASF